MNKINDKAFEKALVEGEKQFRGPHKLGVALIFASLVTGACVGYMGLTPKETSSKTVQKADLRQKSVQKHIQNQR